MAPHNQSNTIDFDAAKLQRLGYASRAQKTLKPVSLAQLRQQLSLQLQTSLETERILELFFDAVQRLVPLSALSYQLASCDLRLDLGERANHSAGYRLNHEGEYLGELTFRRSYRFSEDELGQLESLLASLLFPLRNALKDSLRNVDMVFRYGGEEFLVLLSNTSREAASIVGERLRMAVMGIQYLVEHRTIDLSISLGCASLLPGESMESLLRRADSALYVSKREGRNRLSMAG